MEQPAHDLRPFQASTAVSTERRTVSIGIVVLIHVVAIYALATGLASQLVNKGEQIIKAQIVKEAPPKLPKTPPPPPPEMKKPPPPFIPPPDINLQVQQTAPTITQVTTAITPPAPPPPKPVKAAPPAITAPASIGKAHECQSRYPPLAMRLGHSGTVGIAFTIEPNGSVSNAHVTSSSGHEELDSAAVSCAGNWHYKPAMQNGKPISVPWKSNVVYKFSGGTFSDERDQLHLRSTDNMNSKYLAIAAAILFLSGAGAGPVFAQAANPPAGQAATPPANPNAANPATAPDRTAPPPQASSPPAVAAPAVPAAQKENPYGLRRLWEGTNGHADWVARGVMILLALMSIGTWYIFFTKFWEQARVMGQSRQVERRFWSSNNLNDGIDALTKNSVFRTVAESGVRASSGGSGMVNQNDWIAMSLNRQLEEINARLQGGVSFLASVGSTAPFVGLFGTVWGILNALIAIGVAGQASIDKVAGPVGEALIMTAIGLLVAVPAVLLYNYLVRRNKVINEKLRSFASDLQTYLVTKGK